MIYVILFLIAVAIFIAVFSGKDEQETAVKFPDRDYEWL